MTSTPKPLDNVSTEASSKEEDVEHRPLTTPGHSKPLVPAEASSEEQDDELQSLTTPGHSTPLVSTEASSEEQDGEHQPLTTPGHSKPLVLMEASSGAIICPESKREKSIAKDNNKNVCP